MATENNPPGSPPGQRRRRPPPTIDLKAKEIPTEPVPQPQSESATPVETTSEPPVPAEAAPAAAVPEEPAGASTGRDDVAETQVAESPAGSGHGMGEGPPEPPPPWPESRPPLPWPVIGAALGSVAAVLVLFLALWWLGAFSPPDTAELERKIAALETQLRAVAARPAPAPDGRALSDLTARIDAAEQATRRLAELEARIARAETAAAAPRAPAADPTLASRLAGLDATVKALNDGLAELRKRAEENSAAVRDTASRAAAAESAARAPDPVARDEIDTLTSRIAAIETTLKSFEQRRAAEAGRDRAARFAVAAALLRVAVERGEPYPAELAAVKALGADAALVQPLESFAEKGLPSAETLARALGGIASAMQVAASAPSREAGLIDRLQANAERLVRIRPVNETAGDDGAAVIARAEAKAKRGDLAGARAELAQLPERARAPAQSWIRQSETRAAALDAARRLSAGALAALGDTAPAAKDQQ